MNNKIVNKRFDTPDEWFKWFQAQSETHKRLALGLMALLEDAGFDAYGACHLAYSVVEASIMLKSREIPDNLSDIDFGGKVN